MGKGVPGGYAGMGTPGTDKGKHFCTQHRTRTHTCRTHTHHGGFGLKIDHGQVDAEIIIMST